MKLTTILFDLDGTLLPMDNDEFTRGYFKLLAAKMAPLGYEPKRLVDAVWTGTAAMVKNDGLAQQRDGLLAGIRADLRRPGAGRPPDFRGVLRKRVPERAGHLRL